MCSRVSQPTGGLAIEVAEVAEGGAAEGGAVEGGTVEGGGASGAAEGTAVEGGTAEDGAINGKEVDGGAEGGLIGALNGQEVEGGASTAEVIAGEATPTGGVRRGPKAGAESSMLRVVEELDPE